MSFNKKENFNKPINWILNEKIEDYKSFYEPITFSLNENYLEEVINNQYKDDESSSASDCNEDLTDSEIDTDNSDIIIKQENAKSLTCCVIIDKLDGCIKRCENSESFRKLWLRRVWQVDKGVSEAGGILERLGVYNHGS